VRAVAALYAELGTIVARYDDVKVDGDHAWAVWLHRNPRPDPIGPTASEPALAEITALIARAIRQGYEVPARYYTERNRLAALVAEEQRIAREQKRAEYEARKHDAREAIAAQVANTKSLLAADMAVMSGQQRRLQGILAAAQSLEEGAMKKQIAALAAEGKPVEDADALLAKLAKGRSQGLAFRDARSSRFGNLVRQGWMVPRGKLLEAIDRAARPDDK
jgi:NADH dehydrogenase/NADH:ubiquinone oxidoreductase subunit G